MVKTIYVLREQYAGESKLLAICTNYARAKELAREWFDEEVEELSKRNELETEFSIPDTHEGAFFMEEEVYCDITIRSKESSAMKSLEITAYGADNFIH